MGNDSITNKRGSREASAGVLALVLGEVITRAEGHRKAGQYSMLVIEGVPI